ncbi:MAG: hypothetical protein JNK38_12600 [Acidobacteria bacterium]|nr:hypothetical protein [Acidobacteriota bacterium]
MGTDASANPDALSHHGGVASTAMTLLICGAAVEGSDSPSGVSRFIAQQFRFNSEAVACVALLVAV